MKLLTISILYLFIVLFVNSQPRSIVTSTAFSNGEKLTYSVNYKIGFVNTDVAGVVFSTKEIQSQGASLYEITAQATVYPKYRWFFDLNDTYVCTLSANTLLPKSLKTEIREGKHRFSSLYEYDWNQMAVNTTYHNHKHSEASKLRMELRDNSLDGLALFYNLRCMDIKDFTQGRSETAYLVLEDTIRRMQYRFDGYEVRSIRGIGKFKTLRFKCQLVTSSGEAFADGTELTIWISDDRNKIPLYIETPIRVGSVNVRLTKFENLKYPLDSKLE